VEADSELVVDAYRMLPFAIATQHFQTISRWHSKIAQIDRSIEIAKLAARNFDQISGKSLGLSPLDTASVVRS
jgi:hypothetical protein